MRSNKIRIPETVSVHVHKRSVDYPRDNNGVINSLLHPNFVGRDWNKLKKGDPIFINGFGEVTYYEGEEIYTPVFIGEAAYVEKQIAFSLTSKLEIEISSAWVENFVNL